MTTTVTTASTTIITDNVRNGGGEQDPTILKRYLQCPGMCRVDVLKKFVRNKYNVDTNRFYVSCVCVVVVEGVVTNVEFCYRLIFCIRRCHCQTTTPLSILPIFIHGKE